MDYLHLTIPLGGIITGHILGDEIQISDYNATLLRYYSIGLVLTSTAFNFIPDLKYVHKKNDKPLLISIILISVILMLILNNYLENNKIDKSLHYFFNNLFDIFATGFIIGSATMFKSSSLTNLMISLTISSFFAGITNVHDLIKNKYTINEKIQILLIHFVTYFTGIIIAYIVKHHHYIRLLIAGVLVTIIYWLMIKKIFIWKNNNDYEYPLLLIYIGVLTILLIN